MDCPDFEKFFKKIFFDFKLIFLKSGFFGQALGNIKVLGVGLRVDKA